MHNVALRWDIPVAMRASVPGDFVGPKTRLVLLIALVARLFLRWRSPIAVGIPSLSAQVNHLSLCNQSYSLCSVIRFCLRSSSSMPLRYKQLPQFYSFERGLCKSQRNQKLLLSCLAYAKP